jgi:hypothetical protein
VPSKASEAGSGTVNPVSENVALKTGGATRTIGDLRLISDEIVARLTDERALFDQVRWRERIGIFSR